MSYRYEFDDTRDGDLRLRRTSYEILQDAYLRLRDELEAWNRRALDHGASTPPSRLAHIAAKQLRARSPMLADRIATLSSNGIDRVVDDLARAITAGTTTTATN